MYDPLFKYGQNFYLALTEEAKERILNVSLMFNLTASELASSHTTSGYMLLMPAASGGQSHKRTDGNS